MKHNILKSIFLLAAGGFMLASTGCKKLETFDPEVDPNGASSPNTPGLLTSAESALGGIIGGVNAGGVRAGIYAQYFSETQYTDVSLYAEPLVEMGGTYSGPLGDLQKIIDMNTDPATAGATSAFGSNGNQLGIAKILKAYYMWTITDRWGPVPFSEALKGANNFTPKYDNQSDIYAGLLDLLEEAINDFDNGPQMQGDVLYGGDQGKWKKLANTLRMFISLRMSKVYPDPSGLAATEFAAAAGHPAGYIQDNSDNLSLQYGGGVYQNPWYDTYNGRSDYAMSLTIFDILDNMGDARKLAFGSSGAAFPFGLERGGTEGAVAYDNSVGGNYSRVLEPAFRGETSPIVIVNAASSLLAMAEGMERGWVPNVGAAAIYASAIQASYDQWNLGPASSQIANGQTNFTSGSGGGTDIGYNPAFPSIVGADAETPTALKRIQLQRFLAHYPDGIQGWSEWRRTGVPNLKPTAFATNATEGKQIPRRYVYGTNEYSLNPSGVAGGLSDLTGTGGDRMDSRMWWDKP